MRRATLLLLALALIPAESSLTAPRGKVMLAVEISNAAETLQAVVHATRLGAINPADTEGWGTRKFLVSAPGETELPLEPGSVIELAVEARGYWSPTATVVPDERPQRVTLKLLPSGWITARLRVAENETLPDSVTLRFRPAETEDSIPTAESLVHCSVAGSGVRCEVPAGSLHLRLRAQGFVSHYFWNRPVDAGKSLDLGVLRLQRGASVSGRVDLSDASIRPEHCRVRLAPLYVGASTSRVDTLRRADLELQTGINEHGFFHFDGVTPGDYRLEVHHPGFAPATLEPVRVQVNAESEIRTVMHLEPPLDLEVIVTPAGDAFGKAWRLGLEREDRGTGQLVTVAERPSDATGRAVFSDLAPGNYWIRLVDSAGQRFGAQSASLSPGAATIFLHPELVPVEGTITYGGEPLASDLWFGGRNGMVRIEMRSNREGLFNGFLPRSGIWRLDIHGHSKGVRRSMRALNIQPSKRSGIAELEIELPATELSGDVVAEDSRPFPGALVSVLKMDENSFSSAQADPDGHFEFHGLDYGSYYLNASGPHSGGLLASDSLLIHLSKTAPISVQRVILRESIQLDFEVRSRSGPVPGALVVALPRGTDLRAGTTQIPMQVTDLEGRCGLYLPKSTALLDIVVLPPGHALEAVRFVAPFSTPLQLGVADYGGAITLENAPFNRENPLAPQPVLFRDGVLLDMSLLTKWKANRGGPAQESGDVVLEDLAPGHYSACWVRGEEQAGLAFGTVSLQSEACRHGFLPPHGKLSLGMPNSSSSPQTQ